MTETHLTSQEIADRFRTSVNTVHYWRYIGYGPKSIKVGSKRLYPLGEVERFEAEQLSAGNERGNQGKPVA